MFSARVHRSGANLVRCAGCWLARDVAAGDLYHHRSPKTTILPIFGADVIPTNLILVVVVSLSVIFPHTFTEDDSAVGR